MKKNTTGRKQDFKKRWTNEQTIRQTTRQTDKQTDERPAVKSFLLCRRIVIALNFIRKLVSKEAKKLKTMGF